MRPHRETAPRLRRAAAGAPRPSGAFTIIELLVVVNIVAVLVAVLLPALEKARRSAKDAMCRSQLRQLGVSLTSYATDNGGWYPDRGSAPTCGSNWGDAVSPSAWGFHWQNGTVTFDHHEMIADYLGGGDATACPFSERSAEVAWNHGPNPPDDTWLWVWAGYSVYAGYRGRIDVGFYPANANLSKGTCGAGPKWRHVMPLRVSQAKQGMTLVSDLQRLILDSHYGPPDRVESNHYPGTMERSRFGGWPKSPTHAVTGFSEAGAWNGWSVGWGYPALAEITGKDSGANYVHVDGHVSSRPDTYQLPLKKGHGNYYHMVPQFTPEDEQVWGSDGPTTY